MAIASTEKQLQDFASGKPDGPTYMLNLLEFEPHAEYPGEIAMAMAGSDD